MQYDLDYTEGISQRMRVPEKLKVAPSNAESDGKAYAGSLFPGASMQVPERILLAGGELCIKACLIVKVSPGPDIS